MSEDFLLLSYRALRGPKDKRQIMDNMKEGGEKD